ncbi:MAG: hypothetical protein F4W95_01375 [Chloroflexi bacterium]|nr:hypothetical protein [Chloroflexota bacterium]MYD47117.1 hypothetical protein [Chloroflexota bacterium]
MLDAVNFESVGKPAAVVATTNFVRLATSIARANHLDTLPLVTIPHPLGNREEAAARARAVAAQVVAAITSEPQPARSESGVC